MNGTSRATALARFLKRAVNYLAVEIQYRLSSSYVFGRPYVLIIDTVNICNLRCPLCPTGLNMPGRPKGKMTLDLYKKILDQLGDYALSVVLHNWGEPLLNRDIFRMVEYAKGLAIKTVLSSNLNAFGEEDAAALVGSGLDELIVSLDGATEETYNEYRRGGNFDHVVRNLNLLVRKKKELGSARPKIVWQFLVFKHNAHEVSQAKALARNIGVDSIDIFSAQLGGPGQTPYTGAANTSDLIARWLSPDRRFIREFDYFSPEGYLSPHKCYFLWKTLTVNWEGAVSPCCCVYDMSTDFGDLTRQTLHSIWNNDLYRASRALFGKSANSAGRRSICEVCKIFKKAV